MERRSDALLEQVLHVLIELLLVCDATAVNSTSLDSRGSRGQKFGKESRWLQLVILRFESRCLLEQGTRKLPGLLGVLCLLERCQATSVQSQAPKADSDLSDAQVIAHRWRQGQLLLFEVHARGSQSRNHTAAEPPRNAKTGTSTFISAAPQRAYLLVLLGLLHFRDFRDDLSLVVIVK